MSASKPIIVLCVAVIGSSCFAQAINERCVVKRPRADNGQTVVAKMMVLNDGAPCEMRVRFGGAPATSLVVHTQPENGTLVRTSSEILYTPNPGFVGRDIFDVQWFGMAWGPYLSNRNIRTKVEVRVRARNDEPSPPE